MNLPWDSRNLREEPKLRFTDSIEKILKVLLDRAVPIQRPLNMLELVEASLPAWFADFQASTLSKKTMFEVIERDPLPV